jgi:ATP-binding cassette subfamily C protein
LREERVSTRPVVKAALEDCRRAFWGVALFSAVVNLLMLAGPLYMLQVYDRVLAGRSVPTLIALTALLIAAYAFQGVLDIIRARVVVRGAALLDQQLDGPVYRAVVRLARVAPDGGAQPQPVRDLDRIRAFLTGPGPVAIVDLPWIPVFLIVCTLIHPWLGIVSLAGAVVLFGVTLLTERASRDPAQSLSRESSARAGLVEASRRNSETIVAMGMAPALSARWAATSDRYLDALWRVTDRVNALGSLSKVFRLLLQSLILGLGAYLVIRGELAVGAMIAASIMMGRALAPIETAIANWRGFVAARQSVKRLSETLARTQAARIDLALPAPRSTVSAESVAVFVPGRERPVVAQVNFGLVAREALGIIGPSGSGKTSLVRALVGASAHAGAVRIDGAALAQWDTDALGRHVGYMAQTVELFDGSVAENIARMEVDPDPAAVVAAAVAAGVHDMITRLPAGYETQVGEGGTRLSAGQRQRVALARALYGNPFLIVLDEPNASLDSDGDAALELALRVAKERGAIVVIVAHRPSALTVCDKVLYLANGVQQAFGPRDEVLRRALVQTQQSAAANLRLVGEPALAGGNQ